MFFHEFSCFFIIFTLIFIDFHRFSSFFIVVRPEIGRSRPRSALSRLAQLHVAPVQRVEGRFEVADHLSRKHNLMEIQWKSLKIDQKAMKIAENSMKNNEI